MYFNNKDENFIHDTDPLIIKFLLWKRHLFIHLIPQKSVETNYLGNFVFQKKQYKVRNY